MDIYDVSGNVIPIEQKNPFLDNAVLYEMYSDLTGTKADIQGCCTDGKYLYYCVFARSTLYKYEILTGELTSATYADNVCGHGNGMTYNPNTGYLYITTCNQNGGTGIAVFDTSLNYIETIHVYNDSGVEQVVAGIAWDRKNNVFICCWENDYYVYDSDFNLVRTFDVIHDHPYVYGALDTDGEYLYRPLFSKNTSPFENYIAVYDFSGNLVKVITVDSTLEIEDITHDWNGNWYISINVYNANGWYLFYTGLTKYPEFSAVSQLAQIIVNGTQ